MRQQFVDRYLEQLAKLQRLTRDNAADVVRQLSATEASMFAKSSNTQTYRGLCAAQFRTLRKAIESE